MYADYIFLKYVDDLPFPLIKYNFSNGEYMTSGKHMENESIASLVYNGEFINSGGITGLLREPFSFIAKFKTDGFSDNGVV